MNSPTRSIAGVPFIFLATFAGVQHRRRGMKMAVMLLAVGVALAALFHVVFSSRYGSVWYLDALFRWSLRTGLQRTYGQFLSPGKGILFYMPVVILAVPGLFLMARKYRAVALAAGLPILSTALAYGSYGSWFGGQSWGPRFLLPSVPLFMLGLAPLYDASRRRWQQLLVFTVLALSLLIQLAVVTADWWPGYRPLFDTGPRPEDHAGLQLSNVRLSPPLVQLRAWEPVHLDLLWLRPDHAGNITFSPGLAAGLFTAAIAAIVLWWLVRHKRWTRALLVLPPIASTVLLLWQGAGATPGYPGLPADQARELATTVAAADDGPYTLVTVSNEFHINFYLGFLKGKFIHHWLSPNQTTDFELILERTAGDRLILVVDRVHIDPAFSGKELEWWLNEHLFRVGSKWTEGYEIIEYAILSTDNWQWREAAYTFGDSFSVTGYAINDEQLRPGQILGLQLRICRHGSLPEYHHLFTHLQAPGYQISGHDGPIRYGGTLLVPWEAGDCLVERRAISIPPEAQPGSYNLILGFDTPAGLLPVEQNQTLTANDDYAILDQVTVEPQ